MKKLKDFNKNWNMMEQDHDAVNAKVKLETTNVKRKHPDQNDNWRVWNYVEKNIWKKFDDYWCEWYKREYEWVWKKSCKRGWVWGDHEKSHRIYMYINVMKLLRVMSDIKLMNITPHISWHNVVEYVSSNDWI